MVLSEFFGFRLTLNREVQTDDKNDENTIKIRY